MAKTPQFCKTGKKMEKDNGTGVPQEKKGNNRDDLSFSIVMEQRHLSGDFIVDLPKSFVKNMEIGTKETMLDVGCILWTLKLVIYPNPVRGELSLGWEEFARNHSLKLGDVCTFKMIINNDELLIFEVSIMRGSGVCSRSNGDDEIPSKRKEKSKLSSSQPPKKMKKLENFTQNTRKGKSKQSMPKENGTKCLGKPSSSNRREAAEKANIGCGSKIPQLDGPIPDPYDDVLSTPNVSIMSGSSVCSERNDDNEIPRKRKEKSTLSFSQPRKKAKKVKNLTQNTGKEKKGGGDDLSFSIVMMQTHVSGDFRVGVPSTFSDKYLTDWEGNITLNSEDGETWSVGYISVYMKESIVVRLCRGWKKFAVANHLEIGDKCVFEAIDQNPTELKVVIFRENQDGNRMSKNISFGKEFTTVNPYFKVTLTPTSLHKSITIPKKFLAKYMNQSLEKARLQVENKVFDMKISFGIMNRFVSGVPAFADQNCLKVRDVCYFELIDRATMLFKVSIFRKP